MLPIQKPRKRRHSYSQMVIQFMGESSFFENCTKYGYKAGHEDWRMIGMCMEVVHAKWYIWQLWWWYPNYSSFRSLCVRGSLSDVLAAR
jgi:hypothetical protein